MAGTLSPKTEAQITELTLDREAGALVAPSETVELPVGAGCLLAKAGSEIKKLDNAIAQEMLGNTEKKTITQTGLGATVHFDNGSTLRIEGNTSVGNDHMGEVVQRLGHKSMCLLLLMSQNEVSMDNITAEVKASLVNGEVGAMAKVFGIDFDSDRFKEAEKLLKEITRTTSGEVKGRQQASQFKMDINA